MSGPFGADPEEPDAGDVLRWPAGFSPECSDVWARSELAINAASSNSLAHLSWGSSSEPEDRPGFAA